MLIYKVGVSVLFSLKLKIKFKRLPSVNYTMYLYTILNNNNHKTTPIMAYSYDRENAIKAAYNLKYRPDMTTCRTTAFEIAASRKCCCVILGDNGLFWLLTYADGSRCIRQGLEKAV